MQRRHFNTALATALLPVAAWTSEQNFRGDDDRLAAIERAVGGRLGVAFLDTRTGVATGRRLDERFPMCSTFKWLLAAAVLQRVDAGTDALDRRIVFGPEALLEWSPATRHRVGGDGMRLCELCEAAVTQSDNTAANLLLDRLGGPAAVTRCARALGDTETRLDRTEPALNEATPGDPRDTSTPRAMAAALRGAFAGDALAPASRDQLERWMDATTTGANRLRAGLPADWRVGDKTGTGARGSTNDVAIVRRAGRDPLVVAAFLTDCGAPADRREAALADVGRELARRQATGVVKAQ